MQCTLSWCTSTAAGGVLFTQSPRQLVPAPYKRLIRKAIWALIHIHWERKIYSINSPRQREEEDLGVWNLLWRHLIQWGADFVTSAASFIASPTRCVVAAGAVRPPDWWYGAVAIRLPFDPGDFISRVEVAPRDESYLAFEWDAFSVETVDKITVARRVRKRRCQSIRNSDLIYGPLLAPALFSPITSHPLGLMISGSSYIAHI